MTNKRAVSAGEFAWYGRTSSSGQSKFFYAVNVSDHFESSSESITRIESTLRGFFKHLQGQFHGEKIYFDEELTDLRFAHYYRRFHDKKISNYEVFSELIDHYNLIPKEAEDLKQFIVMLANTPNKRGFIRELFQYASETPRTKKMLEQIIVDLKDEQVTGVFIKIPEKSIAKILVQIEDTQSTRVLDLLFKKDEDLGMRVTDHMIRIQEGC